jgi:hypothetical protein
MDVRGPVQSCVHGLAGQAEGEQVFRVKLKFDEGEHEVRNIDEQATVTWRDGIPSVSKSWKRGQINEIESRQFRSSEIKDPLRDAVTEHGWGWKAVSFRL